MAVVRQTERRGIDMEADKKIPVLILKGAPKIAAAAGVKEDDIKRLVLEEGFPAYKDNGRGPWKIMVCDIEPWCAKQRDRYHKGLGNTVNT